MKGIVGIVTLASLLVLRRDAPAQQSDTSASSKITDRLSVVPDPRLSLYPRTDAVLGDPATTALERLARSVKASAADTTQKLWPKLALGGGIVAALAVTGFALLKCDANCRDDGSLGRLPPVCRCRCSRRRGDWRSDRLDRGLEQVARAIATKATFRGCRRGP